MSQSKVSNSRIQPGIMLKYVYQAVVWVKGDNLFIVDTLSCIDVLFDFLSRLSSPMHVPNPNPNIRVHAKMGTNELLHMMPSTWVNVDNLRLSTAWCEHILIGKKKHR